MDTNTKPESREKVEAWVSYWRGPTNPDENNWQFEQTRAAFYAGYDAARASSPAVPRDTAEHQWTEAENIGGFYWWCPVCDKRIGVDPDRLNERELPTADELLRVGLCLPSPAVPSEAVEVVNDILTNTLSHAEREDSTDDLRRKCRRNAEALRTLLDHVSRPDRQASDAVEKEREKIADDLERYAEKCDTDHQFVMYALKHLQKLRGQSK